MTTATAEQDTKAQIDAESNPAATARAPENPKTYVVEEGDTLERRRREVHVSTKRLERLNPDIDPQTSTPDKS